MRGWVGEERAWQRCVGERLCTCKGRANGSLHARGAVWAPRSGLGVGGWGPRKEERGHETTPASGAWRLARTGQGPRGVARDPPRSRGCSGGQGQRAVEPEERPQLFLDPRTFACPVWHQAAALPHAPPGHTGMSRGGGSTSCAMLGGRDRIQTRPLSPVVLWAELQAGLPGDAGRGSVASASQPPASGPLLPCPLAKPSPEPRSLAPLVTWGGACCVAGRLQERHPFCPGVPC